jgi:Rrf2 family protein
MGNAKPMLITQKKQYALRAVYELAKHREKGPIKSAQIAEAQAIPQRFLEIILNRLKHAGILTAKRGYTGGFELNRAPGDITVEDIFKSLEGIDEATVCVSCISKADCPFYGACAFLPLWTQMQKAIDRICTDTTIQSLLDDPSVPTAAEP